MATSPEYDLYGDVLIEHIQTDQAQAAEECDQLRSELSRLVAENEHLAESLKSQIAEGGRLKQLLYDSICTARRDVAGKEDEINVLSSQLNAPYVAACPACERQFNVSACRPPKPAYVRVLRSRNCVELQFRNYELLTAWVEGYGLQQNTDGLPTLPGKLEAALNKSKILTLGDSILLTHKRKQVDTSANTSAPNESAKNHKPAQPEPTVACASKRQKLSEMQQTSSKTRQSKEREQSAKVAEDDRERRRRRQSPQHRGRSPSRRRERKDGRDERPKEDGRRRASGRRSPHQRHRSPRSRGQGHDERKANPRVERQKTKSKERSPDRSRPQGVESPKPKPPRRSPRKRPNTERQTPSAQPVKVARVEPPAATVTNKPSSPKKCDSINEENLDAMRIEELLIAKQKLKRQLEEGEESEVNRGVCVQEEQSKADDGDSQQPKVCAQKEKEPETPRKEADELSDSGSDLSPVFDCRPKWPRPQSVDEEQDRKENDSVPQESLEVILNQVDVQPFISPLKACVPSTHSPVKTPQPSDYSRPSSSNSLALSPLQTPLEQLERSPFKNYLQPCGTPRTPGKRTRRCQSSPKRPSAPRHSPRLSPVKRPTTAGQMSGKLLAMKLQMMQEKQNQQSSESENETDTESSGNEEVEVEQNNAPRKESAVSADSSANRSSVWTCSLRKHKLNLSTEAGSPKSSLSPTKNSTPTANRQNVWVKSLQKHKPV